MSSNHASERAQLGCLHRANARHACLETVNLNYAQVIVAENFHFLKADVGTPSAQMQNLRTERTDSKAMCRPMWQDIATGSLQHAHVVGERFHAEVYRRHAQGSARSMEVYPVQRSQGKQRVQ